MALVVQHNADGYRYEIQRRLTLDSAIYNISVLSPVPGGMGEAYLTNRGPFVTRLLWSYVMPGDI